MGEGLPSPFLVPRKIKHFEFVMEPKTYIIPFFTTIILSVTT